MKYAFFKLSKAYALPETTWNIVSCFINIIIILYYLYVIIDKVEDISGLITALILTKYKVVSICIFTFVYLQYYCSLKAETLMHMTY